MTILKHQQAWFKKFYHLHLNKIELEPSKKMELESKILWLMQKHSLILSADEEAELILLTKLFEWFETLFELQHGFYPRRWQRYQTHLLKLKTILKDLDLITNTKSVYIQTLHEISIFLLSYVNDLMDAKTLYIKQLKCFTAVVDAIADKPKQASFNLLLRRSSELVAVEFVSLKSLNQNTKLLNDVFCQFATRTKLSEALISELQARSWYDLKALRVLLGIGQALAAISFSLVILAVFTVLLQLSLVSGLSVLPGLVSILGLTVGILYLNSDYGLFHQVMLACNHILSPSPNLSKEIEALLPYLGASPDSLCIKSSIN